MLKPVFDVAKQVLSLTRDVQQSKEDLRALNEDVRDMRKDFADLRDAMMAQRLEFAELLRVVERLANEVESSRTRYEYELRLVRLEHENSLLKQGRLLPSPDPAKLAQEKTDAQDEDVLSVE